MEAVGWSVRWHASDSHDANAPAPRDPVLVHARDQWGEGVRTGRLCPACAAVTHGQPWVRGGPGPAYASLARHGEHVVTVVADQPVGVDVESIETVANRWDPALVLAPGEAAATADEQAWTWAAKEAILKARGTGLAVPMESTPLAGARLETIAAPPGLVAVVALATSRT